MMKDSNNQPSHLNEGEKKTLFQKTKNFIDNTKKTVRDTIAATGIAVSTLMPASVESLSTIAPTAAKVVAIPTAAALVTACHDDLDTTPPKIDVIQNEVEIQGGETLRISGNQIYVGNTLLFRCSDNVSSSLNISLTFNGNPISSGYVFNESGTLSIKVTDEAGNTSNASLQINKKEVIKEPEFTVLKSQVDISKGGETKVDGKEFSVGQEKMIIWTEDNCTPSIKFDGKDVKIGYVIENEGILTFTLTNEKGVSKSTNINAVDGNEVPEITRKYPEDKVPNILGGVVAKGENNKLLFGDVVMYEGKDDNTQVCTPSLKLKGTDDDKIGKEISTSGTYVFTLTDEKGKSTPVEFLIESKSIDLTNLNSLNMQVGEEVDLLKGITVPSGIQISKVEVEINGQRQEIKENNGCYPYTPSQPGTCYIYVTEKGEFNNTYVEKSKNPLTIKDIEYPEYQSINISNIKPVDILPIIGQVEVGDRNVYDHIEHLRVAEATKISDMMRKYGTGNYNKEKYQELMSRLNTGMLRETPIGWDNYEDVGNSRNDGTDPGGHAYRSYYILNTLIKNANFKIIDNANHRENLYNLCKSDPNKINIMGLSRGADVERAQYDARNENKYKEYDKEKNRLIFCAGGNIYKDNGVLKNKTYQDNYSLPDDSSVYGERSRAHSRNDNTLDRHIVLTISTDKTGDINQTNEDSESSMFPVGFHDKVLFAGRDFPSRLSPDKKIRADSYKYPTSFTNYVNVALADLCFQMHADVKDVDELLEMIRSTALTDYIRFDLNGDGDTNDNVDGQPETQPLQLINPAGVFKKYCMISDIPSTIKTGETITLTKGWYKGIIFDIPGAEVKINGQWVPYNKSNESLIKSQNPMNLEWRLNANEAMKYGNKNLKGKMIAVDDQWNGLSMDKEISVNIN